MHPPVSAPARLPSVDDLLLPPALLSLKAMRPRLDRSTRGSWTTDDRPLTHEPPLEPPHDPTTVSSQCEILRARALSSASNSLEFWSPPHSKARCESHCCTSAETQRGSVMRALRAASALSGGLQDTAAAWRRAAEAALLPIAFVRRQSSDSQRLSPTSAYLKGVQEGRFRADTQQARSQRECSAPPVLTPPAGADRVKAAACVGRAGRAKVARSAERAHHR